MCECIVNQRRNTLQKPHFDILHCDFAEAEAKLAAYLDSLEAEHKRIRLTVEAMQENGDTSCVDYYENMVALMHNRESRIITIQESLPELRQLSGPLSNTCMDSHLLNEVLHDNEVEYRTLKEALKTCN